MIEFKLGNGVIGSYKRLSYQPWYALAEFVDNSTQAYFNNKNELNKILAKEGNSLTVSIQYDYEDDSLIIEDNSIGMNLADIQRALTLGISPEFKDGRSKYGLGLKTAACWFGDNWQIKTTKLGDDKLIEVFIDVNKLITNGDNKPNELENKVTDIDKDTHFTIISIYDLNRSLRGRTLSKIKDYLCSMYRMDFSDYGLKLYWQNNLITWDELDSKLYKTHDGEIYKKKFSFNISNGKNVKGWVGVLGKGHTGRKNAGFSILKANRVIEGWPKGFKPDSIFGDLDDGRNDLVNQRLVGELFLDDFEVSHTKDAIVWLDEEYQQVDSKLDEICKEAVYLANTISFKETRPVEMPAIRNQAIEAFESEVNSGEFKSFLATIQPPTEEILESAIKRYQKRSRKGKQADIKVEIGVDFETISVSIYFVENSEFDPYVVIQTSADKNNKVIVIINALHPHYIEMTNAETLTNFIRHCVYDGVAEWKAIKLLGRILPYTVKNLKDGLLRIPFNIKQNQFGSN